MKTCWIFVLDAQGGQAGSGVSRFTAVEPGPVLGKQDSTRSRRDPTMTPAACHASHPLDRPGQSLTFDTDPEGRLKTAGGRPSQRTSPRLLLRPATTPSSPGALQAATS